MEASINDKKYKELYNEYRIRESKNYPDDDSGNDFDGFKIHRRAIKDTSIDFFHHEILPILDDLFDVEEYQPNSFKIKHNNKLVYYWPTSGKLRVGNKEKIIKIFNKNPLKYISKVFNVNIE